MPASSAGPLMRRAVKNGPIRVSGAADIFKGGKPMIDYAKYPPRWVDLSEVGVNDRAFLRRKVLRTQADIGTREHKWISRTYSKN